MTGFEQGGQLDWVGLASTTVSIPLGIIQRLSQAGLDPYTLELVKMLGRCVRMSERYLDDIERRLQSTRRLGFFSSNTIFFGTGISDIPRMLGTTRHGVACSGLVIALRTFFSSSYTARVLLEMLRLSTGDKIDLPSLTQFEALGNELSAVMGKHELLTIMQSLDSLYPDDWNRKNSGYKSSVMPPTPPKVSDLAEVLLTVSNIEALDQIIIYSTRWNSSWLAAVIHRMFGLHVILQINSKIIWEPLTVPEERNETPGTVVIKVGDEKVPSDETYNKAGDRNEMKLFRATTFHFGLTQGEFGGDGPPRPTVDLPTAFRYLIQWTVPEIQSEEIFRIGQETLKNVARMLFVAKGAPLCVASGDRDRSQRFCALANSPRFQPTHQKILNIMKLLDPTMSLTIDDIAEAEQTIVFTESRVSLLAAGNYSDRDKLGILALGKVPVYGKNRRETDGLMTALFELCLILFLIERADDHVDIRINTIALKNLFAKIGNGYDDMSEFLNFESLYGLHAEGGKPRCECEHVHWPDEIYGTDRHPAPPLGPHSVPLMVLHVPGILKNAYYLLHAALPLNDRALEKSMQSLPVAISGDGRYSVLSVMDKRYLDNGSCYKILHGYGGIFMHRKAVEELYSMRVGESRINEPFCNIDILEQLAYVQRLEEGDENLSVPSSNLSPLKLESKLLAHERGGKAYVGWSITGRSGPEMAVDVLIPPIELVLQHLSGANQSCISASVNSWRLRSMSKVALVNVEALVLAKLRNEAPAQKVIVMAKRDDARQMLAPFQFNVTFWDGPGRYNNRDIIHRGHSRSGAVIIRHNSQTMSFQESVEKFKSIQGRAILLVV